MRIAYQAKNHEKQVFGKCSATHFNRGKGKLIVVGYHSFAWQEKEFEMELPKRLRIITSQEEFDTSSNIKIEAANVSRALESCKKLRQTAIDESPGSIDLKNEPVVVGEKVPAKY